MLFNNMRVNKNKLSKQNHKSVNSLGNMQAKLRYSFLKTCQILVTPLIIKKKKKQLNIVSVSVLIVSLFLLFWTYDFYIDQKEGMRRIISEVLGKERNTTLAVLPNVKTTILEPTHSCQFQGKNALAILMVVTMPENRQRREIIRKTWASTKYEGQIMVFFFSGRPKSEDFTDLLEEGHLHGDLIVDDLYEHYYGLTIKTLSLLKWFLKNCPKSSFLIKADDDVYINLETMTHHLKQIQKSSPEFKIGGRLLKGRTPNTMNPFSKWYTPSEFLPEDFKPPNYLGGPCYVIKGDFVSQLFNASLDLPLYHLEDVFLTGFVTSQKLHVQQKEFPETLDPKYPRLTYYTRKIFGTLNSLTSFHLDGDVELMKSIFDEIDST